MKERTQRYAWEDALVDAQASKLIDNGALMVCLKLARAVNWKPKNGRPAGLYWKNEEALKRVGSSRAQYYRHMPRLVELGFFTLVGGNLLPQVPALSQVEAVQSQVETTESQVETEKSLGDNPFSVDILSEDVCSEDSFTETTVADAPVVESKNDELKKVAMTDTSPRAKATTGSRINEEPAKSKVETDATLYKGQRYWSIDEVEAVKAREAVLASISDEW